MAKAQGQFDGIQALRFIAAIMVVVTHATFYVSERLIPGFPVWDKGASGVDVFFVISGFVMMISSQSLVDRPDGWQQFGVRRIIRIVPLYWAALSLKALFMLVAPGVTLLSAIDPTSLITSYLFIPSFNADGEIKPLLGVGWTLNFEMFFYVLFALALALRVDPLKFVSGAFVVCCTLALFRTEHWPSGAFYCDTIVLEFAFGMLLARAIMRGFRLPAFVCVALIMLGFSALFQTWYSNDSFLWRPVLWGLPAALIVTGAACLNPVIEGKVPKVLIALGEASYALYLFHPMIAPAAPALLAKLGIRNAPLSIAMSISVAVIVTWFIYRWAEKPTTEFLRRLTTGRTPRNVGTVAAVRP